MTTTAPKKDFWAPFRADLKTFLTKTAKAIAAGATTAVGTTGALLGGELSSGKFDLSSDLPGLALTFVGTFIAGFAAAYATTNA